MAVNGGHAGTKKTHLGPRNTDIPAKFATLIARIKQQLCTTDLLQLGQGQE